MSSVIRVFLASDSINGSEALITGTDARHILKVMRKQAGDIIDVCDMHGVYYKATIKEISKDRDALKVFLGEGEKRDCELPFSVKLYQCMPKGDKLDTVVQKAVELGASEIIAVASERCVARPEKAQFEKRLGRLQKISESASAQCGRNFVPRVSGLVTFDEALNDIKNCENGFICYEGDETQPLRDILKPSCDKAFLIGPEGGLSEAETEKAKSLSVPLAGLGKRILRTETAGLYVLSAISAILE